jgi:hypothetical protein
MTEVTAGRNKRSRPVGYAPWEPRPATREALDQILAVLAGLADYWPIVPRQVLYRLMGLDQATKADDDRIGDYLVRGRRAGLIPWEAIGDGRTEALFPTICDDPEAFFAEMRQSASVYRLDRQAGQPVYIEVVVEAKGAVEQIYGTTGDAYGIPVLSGSGFVAITALRNAVLRAEQREMPTTVLVLGDYDPAGIDIRSRVADDIEAFADGHDVDITVQTIALTETPIDDLGLIKAEMTAEKRRKYPWWPHDWTVELEAVSPADLAAIVVDAIESRTDPDTRQAVIDREAEERADLMRQLEEGGE